MGGLLCIVCVHGQLIIWFVQIGWSIAIALRRLYTPTVTLIVRSGWVIEGLGFRRLEGRSEVLITEAEPLIDIIEYPLKTW